MGLHEHQPREHQPREHQPREDQPHEHHGRGAPAASPPTSRLGPLLVVLAAVCWGTGGLVGSVVGERSGLSPVAVAAYRLLVAAVVLLAVHAVRGELGRLRAMLARLRAEPGGDGWRVLGVGAGLVVFQVCYFLAVRAVGVSVATMLTLGLAPVLVTGGAALLLGERVGSRLRVALPTALVGLVLLVGVGGQVVGGEGRSVLGGVLAAVSATGYAAVTLLGRTLAGRVASEHVTSLGFTVAAVLALPVGLAVGMTAAPEPGTVALLAYLGVVPTALAYALFFAGLRGTPSGAASVLTLVEPLTATVLAVALLDERLATGQWVGAALLAVVVLLLASRPGGRGVSAAPTARRGGGRPGRGPARPAGRTG